MKPQGKYPCMIIGEELLSCSEEMIMEEVKKFSENNSHFYIIPDYTTDNQGQKIAEVFGKERLLTGGSGILEHLAAQYREEYECQGENILPDLERRGRELHFQEAAVPPHADSAEPTGRIIRRLPFTRPKVFAEFRLQKIYGMRY